jgi:hypothetical protein
VESNTKIINNAATLEAHLWKGKLEIANILNGQKYSPSFHMLHWIYFSYLHNLNTCDITFFHTTVTTWTTDITKGEDKLK